MDNRAKKLKKISNKVKCAYSGRFVGNNEVILTKFAVDYVRKLGYLVSNFKVK